jgi:dipeptidyl aminopeptidase/acylaminoacyl peptidase
MSSDLARYVVNPGPKAAVTGLEAAVTTDSSIGGTMTNWLVTQDTRFAAAIPQFPAANWVSRHLTSYFSRWVFTFLDGHYKDLESKYHSRSPVMFAHQVRTPTLNICGALDQCTLPAKQS